MISLFILRLFFVEMALFHTMLLIERGSHIVPVGTERSTRYCKIIFPTR